MPKIVTVAAALMLGTAAAMAQTASTPDVPSKESLSLDQQSKIGEIITNDDTTPLSGTNFSLSVDSTVPAQIQLRRLPPAAEASAPKFRGYSYVMVEEQIALVEPRSRRIVAVIPRWRSQQTDAATKRGTSGSGEGNTR